jgi:hypothetical protein
MPKRAHKIKFNSEIFTQKIEKITNRIPNEVDGLAKFEKNEVEGLYKKIEGEVLSLLEEIRRSVIENRLLSQDELEILEHVHERFKGEYNLEDVINQLKEVVHMDVKHLQDVIVELSRKGMITVKLFVE